MIFAGSIYVSGQCSPPAAYKDGSWFQMYQTDPYSLWIYGTYSDAAITTMRSDNKAALTQKYTCESSFMDGSTYYYITSNRIIGRVCAKSSVISGGSALFVTEIGLESTATSSASQCPSLFVKSCFTATGTVAVCSSVFKPKTPLASSPVFSPVQCPFQGMYQVTVNYTKVECAGDPSSSVTVLGSDVHLAVCSSQAANSTFKERPILTETLTCMGDIDGAAMTKAEADAGQRFLLLSSSDQLTLYCARYVMSGGYVYMSIDVTVRAYAVCGPSDTNTAKDKNYLALQFGPFSTTTGTTGTTIPAGTGTSAAATPTGNTGVSGTSKAPVGTGVSGTTMAPVGTGVTGTTIAPVSTGVQNTGTQITGAQTGDASTGSVTTGAATTGAQTTGALTTGAQTTMAPTTMAPTTAEATTAAPTTAVPTTAAPSTAAPSTAAPSTAAPTTAAPSTAAPTTAAPTTAAPTTAAPTTAAPTTAAPTTAAPTTAAPTTAGPMPSTAASSTSPVPLSTLTPSAASTTPGGGSSSTSGGGSSTTIGGSNPSGSSVASTSPVSVTEAPTTINPCAAILCPTTFECTVDSEGKGGCACPPGMVLSGNSTAGDPKCEAMKSNASKAGNIILGLAIAFLVCAVLAIACYFCVHRTGGGICYRGGASGVARPRRTVQEVQYDDDPYHHHHHHHHDQGNATTFYDNGPTYAYKIQPPTFPS